MTANKKYYVNADCLITVQCPVCVKTRTTSVESFRGKNNVVKIKCSCGNIFSIEIEYRKNYRKKTNIYGKYRSVLEPSYIQRDCIIINLSITGVAVKILDGLKINNDDELIINFTLDDPEKHEIEKTVKVLHVDVENRIIGGEFLYSKIRSYDKFIYFYLK